MTRLREHIGPALFEATFVVFGVIIAYAVNEWREKRVHRQDAVSARVAIVQELSANRGAAAASLAYHQELMDSLRTIAARKGRTDIRTFGRGFTMPAQLGNVAWEVAEQTGVLNHMPFDEVLQLSRVYRDQERYEQQAAMTGNVIYAELYRAGPMDMAARGGQLSSLIMSFAYRERALIALYDSTLASLSVGTAAPARAGSTSSPVARAP